MKQAGLIQNTILSVGLLFLSASLIGWQNVNDGRAKVVDVTFCDLVREPSKYDGRVVRVAAIYSAIMHTSYLYEPNCNSRDHYIHSRLDCDSDESCKNLQDLLSKNSSSYIIGSRTNIVAVGIFKGPGDSGRGYGLESAFHFELDIKHIEKAAPTQFNIPWPK